MPEVSVIIPAYNAGRFLGEALESVLRQTFQDFEVIVVDDGSTDNTAEVVARFADSRTLYIYHEKNRGLPAARNTGICASMGKYVAFLDADDWYLPRKLEVQVSYLNEHPTTGLVASGWVETDAQGKMFRVVKPWPNTTRSFSLKECVLGLPLVVHCVLVRREWLETVGLFDESMRWVEDTDLWLRLLAAGCQFAWLPEIVCCRRFHAHNMSREVKRMHDGGIAVLNKLYARNDLPSEVRDQANLAYASIHVSAAARALGHGMLDEARYYIEQAIADEPALLQGFPCLLIQMLVGFENPTVDRREYLNALTYLLSDKVVRLRQQLRKALAAVYMGHVFAGWAYADARVMRLELLKALWLDPSWLLNRGVRSIAARLFILYWLK